MKKIDRLLLTSFISPFIVTFMIAIFVLLMQTLWLYIDDIAGKGLGFFLVVELLSYKCVSLIPLALPLAMLISSVMVLGNLAEHYELSSMKSAGVRLLRIMRPLMLFGIGSLLLSFFCSNNLIPVANLQFGSRMYDIQRQKPALRLEAGIFNDDFQGYAIHIGKKDLDGKSIEEVLIYDHGEANQGRISQIIAEKGNMYMSDDGKYFVMNLNNGHQYIETKPGVRGGSKSYPFIRTSFESWNKVFDLSEFELSQTNRELFKQNRSMMSSGQLRVAVDSIEIKINHREKSLANHVSSYFHFMYPDSSIINIPDEVEEEPEEEEEEEQLEEVQDSTEVNNNEETDSLKINLTKEQRDSIEMEKAVNAKLAETKKQQAFQKQGTKPTPKRNNRPYGGRPIRQNLPDSIENIEKLIQTFPKYEQLRLYSKAKTFARSILSQSEAANRALDRMKESKVKHIYDLHTKYSMAVVCFVFLFIGAPMGAIVRKGGFGYPILIAIIFFMIFVVLTIFCRKIAETFVVPASAAAWIPCAIMFPVGLFLTYKAMNDSKVIDLSRYTGWVRKLIKKINIKKRES